MCTGGLYVDDADDTGHLDRAFNSGSRAECLNLPMLLYMDSELNINRWEWSDIDVMTSVRDILAFETIPPENDDGCNFRIETSASIHPGYLYLVPHGFEVNQQSNRFTWKNGVPYMSSLKTEQHRRGNIEAMGVGQYTQHGPALNDALNILEIDEVACVRYTDWPSIAMEWPTRRRHSGWPDVSLVFKVIAQGCHVVPVGYTHSKEKDIEWRFSFSAAERTLAKSLNDHQRQCYLLLKMVYLQELKQTKTLCTYYLKTLLFWACEKIPPDKWRDDTIGTNFLYLLDSLLHCLSTGNLQHYFIPDNNLLDHIPRKILQDMAIKVSRVREDPLGHLLQLTREGSFLSGPFSISKADILAPVLEDIDSGNAEKTATDEMFLLVIRKLVVAYISDSPFSNRIRKDLREWLGCIGYKADGPVMFLTSPLFPLTCAASQYQDLHATLGLTLEELDQILCTMISNIHNETLERYLVRSKKDPSSERLLEVIDTISKRELLSTASEVQDSEGQGDDEGEAPWIGEAAFMELHQSLYEIEREGLKKGRDLNIAMLVDEVTGGVQQLLSLCDANFVNSTDLSSQTLNSGPCRPLPLLTTLFSWYILAMYDNNSTGSIDSLASLTKKVCSGSVPWAKPCAQHLLGHAFMHNNELRSAQNLLEELVMLEPDNKVIPVTIAQCKREFVLATATKKDTTGSNKNSEDVPTEKGGSEYASMELGKELSYGHLVPGFIDAPHQYQVILYHIHSFRTGKDNMFKSVVYQIIKKYALDECKTQSEVHHFNTQIATKVLCGSILCDDGKLTEALEILMPIANTASGLRLLEMAQIHTENLREAQFNTSDPVLESVTQDFLIPGTQVPFCIVFDKTNDNALDEDLKIGLHGEYHTLQLHILVYACYLATKCHVKLQNITAAKHTIEAMLKISEEISFNTKRKRGVQVDVVCNNYNMLGFAFKLLGDHQRAVVAFGVAGNIEYALPIGASPAELLSWDDEGAAAAAAVPRQYVQSSLQAINPMHALAQVLPLTITYMYPVLSWEESIKYFFLLLHPADELFMAVRSFFKHQVNGDRNCTIECILLFMFTLRKWLPWLESLHAMIQAPTHVMSLETFLSYLGNDGRDKESSILMFLMRALPNLTGLEDIQKFLIGFSYPSALETDDKLAALFQTGFKEADQISVGCDLGNGELKAALAFLRVLYPELSAEQAASAYVAGLKPKTIHGEPLQVFLRSLPPESDLRPDISLARMVCYFPTSSFPAACLLFFLLVVYPDMEVEEAVHRLLGVLYPEKSPEERLIYLIKLFFCNYPRKSRRVRPPFRSKRLAVPTRTMTKLEPVDGQMVMTKHDIYWASKGLDKPPI